MRPFTVLVLCSAVGLALPSVAHRHAVERASAAASLDPAARWPVRFETNRGQSRRPAAFLGEVGSQRWRFRLGSIEVEREEPGLDSEPIRLTWVGASPMRLEPQEPLPLRSHYVDDPDPARRQLDVPNFGALQYRRVYPGIDVRFRDAGGGLGHDFALAPGANPHVIRIRFDGAEDVRLGREGELLVEGRATALVFAEPRAFQESEGAPSRVTARYEVDRRRHEVTFAVSGYDACRPLRIGVPGPVLP